MRLEELQNKKLIWDYYLESGEKTKTALDNFLAQTNGDEKLIKSVGAINDKFLSAEDNKYFLALKKALLKFLYPSGLNDCVNFKDNVAFKNTLGIQLFYLGIVLNGYDQITPYSIDEVQSLVTGTADYYSDAAMIVTLRDILLNDSDENSGKINLLTAWLPEAILDEENDDRYDWLGALIFTMLIHAVWSKFSVLSEKNQKIILSSYIYLGSIAGVNLKLIFEKLNFSQLPNNLNIAEEIINNKEQVNISSSESMRLSDLVQFYFQKGIDGYSKEEYLNDLYKDSDLANKSIYISWLRDTLNSLMAVATLF